MSGIFNGKVELTDKFIHRVCADFGISEEWVRTGQGDMIQVHESPPTSIAEQIGEGYTPEVKLMADYLEVKVKGKTAEERLQIVEDIMADIRSKYK